MATMSHHRVAPVTARDGVDTRNQDKTLCPSEFNKGAGVYGCMLCDRIVGHGVDVCSDCLAKEAEMLEAEAAYIEGDFYPNSNDDWYPDGDDYEDDMPVANPVYKNVTHEKHDKRHLVNVQYGSSRNYEKLMRIDAEKQRLQMEQKRLEVARSECPIRQQIRCQVIKTDLFATAFHPSRVEQWIKAEGNWTGRSSILEMMFG